MHAPRARAHRTSSRKSLARTRCTQISSSSPVLAASTVLGGSSVGVAASPALAESERAAGVGPTAKVVALAHAPKPLPAGAAAAAGAGASTGPSHCCSMRFSCVLAAPDVASPSNKRRSSGHGVKSSSSSRRYAYLLFGFTLARANARMLINAEAKRRSARNSVRASRPQSTSAVAVLG